ncbi:MAG: hypothetical protein WA446_18260 [Steroidobacteraceae bacterium]
MSSASTSSPAPVQPLTQRLAWKALTQHYRAVRGMHLRQLFAEDPRRRERLTPERLNHDSSTNALIWRYRRFKKARS